MTERQLEIESKIKHLGNETLPKNAKLMLFGSQARYIICRVNLKVNEWIHQKVS